MSQAYDFIKGFDEFIKAKKKREQAASRGALDTAVQSAARKVSQAGSTVQRSSQTPASEPQMAQWLWDALNPKNWPAAKEKAKAIGSKTKERLSAAANNWWEEHQAKREAEYNELLTLHEKYKGYESKNAVQKSALTASDPNYVRYLELLDKFDGNHSNAEHEPVMQLLQMPEIWDDVLALFDDGYDFGDGTRTGLRFVGDLLGTAAATAGDIGVDLSKGVLKTSESVADWLGGRVADVSEMLGQDDYADEVRMRIEDNMIEDLFEDVDLFLDKGSLLGHTGDAVAEGVGQATLLSALGQFGNTPLGATAITGGTGFISGWGSGEAEALQAGATPEEAKTYGMISGAADFLTEMLFGGLGKTSNALGFGKGLSSADDMLAKAVSGKISNTLAKNLVQFGIKSGAEGLEEVLAGLVQAWGKKLTYMSEEDFRKILSDENLLEQFVVGSLSSGFMQGGDLVRSTKAGRDFVTGLSADEQAVADSVFEKEVSSLEENGEKLSGKAKAKLFDSIVERMKKGFISTDDIEAALSGETFQKYKDTTEQKNKLQAEYDELYQMKNGDKSDAQRDRQAELKAQLAQLDPGQYRSQLDEEMSRRLKDSYLAESYNERTRRGQAFQADLSQYKNETARKTVQNIMDAGVANNTNRFREFVDFIAKISGDKGIVFSVADAKKLKETGYAINDGTVNGYYDDSGITVNISSSKALNSIVGHELTHALEGTDFYETLKDTVLKYAKDKGNYDSLAAAFRRIYQGKKGYETDFESKLEREIVADLIGDYVFTDADFINNLSTEHRNVFQKLYDEIKYLVKVATAGSKEARELEKVKKLFDEAYRNTKNTAQPDGVKYDVDNEKVIDLSKDNVLLKRLSGVYGAKRYKEIQNYILETLSDQPIKLSDGKEAVVDRRDALHIANKAADKKTAEISHIKELVESAELYAEDKNAEHNKFDYFCYYVADVRFDNEIFPIYLNVGLGKFDRRYHLYDITNRIRDTADRINGLERPGGYALTNGVSKNIIGSDPQNVNGKLSISENGRDVSYSGENVYGADVALESREENMPADNRPKVDYSHPFPTQEDIEAMRLEAEENAQAPEDGIAMLIRGLEEIRKSNANQTVPQASTTENRAKAEKIVGDRNAIISQRAQELYQEISNLKKGVRASKSLGYLLDHGYSWQSIKTALLNIRDNPDQTVNPNSAMESITRKMLNDEYETQVYEWEQLQAFAPPAPSEIHTVKDRNQAKLHNYVTEINRNMEMRDDVAATYNEKIAQLQARYDAMKNKATVAANNLFRQIERTKRLRDNAAADYEKRLSDLTSRVQKMTSEEFKTAEQRQYKQEEYASWAENLVGDTSTWVDKKTGLGYMINTLRRNLRAIVKDANGKSDYKKADAIYEALQGTYNRNEAELNRELAKLRAKYANLNITKAEDAYIQMLGEYRSNPSTTLTEDVINEYYEKHKKNIDTNKVDQIIEMARQDYDSLIQRVNTVLRAQGMKEIPYRKGYFPHFTQDKQGPLAKLLNWKTKNDDIPTDIAGLTEQFEPVRSYQAFNKRRVTDITDYSFTKGFDTYSFGALDWIYHIEDIQKRRALENYIRYVHSDEGVKQKVAEIRANESYDADEAQEQIDLVYKEARNPLNNLVIDLRRGTQTLAGKKSSLDREMEYNTNRKIYSTMTNISSRVSANMVAGSVSAALTNFIPITQSWGTVSPLRSIQAMAQTMKSAIRDDGMVDKSTFLTNRLRSAESLNKTGWDKFSDKISWLMNAVDSFTSQTVWRSKYDENIAQGMSENEAILNADNFAEGVLAGRSRGNMPTVFDSKNPIVKMLTAFQLEVANQYGYLFQDMPQEVKNKNIARLVGKYAEVFVGAYVYNALFSALTGRTAAFDPFRIIEEMLKDVGVGDDEEDEDGLMWSEVLGNLSENILQEVPFVGGLLGGGRVPISSALPYDSLAEAFTGTIKDIENQDWENLTKEWMNPLLYVVSPMAGGQAKKTIEGVSMFLGDKPVAGSYTTDGALRFPVEPTTGNVIQSALFGQWANKNAQDYIEQGQKPLSEKQIQEFMDLNLPIQEYWQYKDELNALSTFEEKADFIANLDLPTWKKNILINNVSNRKDDIDLENYEQFGSWAEFDFSINNPEKYAFLEERGISYGRYLRNKDEFDFAYQNPDKYDFLNENAIAYKEWKGFSETEKDAWTWAFNNQDQYLLSQAVTGDVAEYRKYAAALYDIRADKDKNGKSISGSAKKKKRAYINSLPLSKEEKMILFKMEYPSHDDDNREIINYIIDLKGYTKEEKTQMLEELGFTVKDGKVSWN